MAGLAKASMEVIILEVYSSRPPWKKYKIKIFIVVTVGITVFCAFVGTR